jgi:hypothetical protein
LRLRAASKHQGALSALAAVLLVGLTLNGCGSSSQGVITVGSNSISKAAYDHWLGAVIALASYAPQEPPRTFDPPNFTKCIVRLRLIAPLQNAAHLSSSQLKATCQTEYAQLRERTASLLIYDYALRSEAAARHIDVSDAEVVARFKKIRQQVYPNVVEFRKALASSHQTTSDLLFEVKNQLLAAKLQHQLAGSLKSRTEGAAEAAFALKLQERWKSRTSCQPGYIVNGCKQFK